MKQIDDYYKYLAQLVQTAFHILAWYSHRAVVPITKSDTTLRYFNFELSFKGIISGIQLYNKKDAQKQKYYVNKNTNKCNTGKTGISSLLFKRKMSFGK